MAQVVERYFREVEAASSSLVTPIEEWLFLLIGIAIFFIRKQIKLKNITFMSIDFIQN